MTITYNKQVLLKRGNTTISSTYVGPISELTYDTGLNAIRVHDGVTPGGELMPTATQYADIIANVNPFVANISVIQSDIIRLYANAATQSGLIANIVIPPAYSNVNVESFLITNNYVTDTYVTSAIGNIVIPPEYGNINVESYLSTHPTANLVNGSSTISLRADGQLTFPDTTLQGTAFQDVAQHIFFVHVNTRTYTPTGTYNSPYRTITAAFDAAVLAGHDDSNPATIILLSNITENVTLKPGIFLTSLGAGTHGSPAITGTITVTSSMGSTVTNHYSISNLRVVAPTDGICINFIGTAPQKLFIRDMWLDANGTGTGIVVNNTGTGSTVQMDTGHLAHSGSGDVYCINVINGNCYVTDIETTGTTQVAAVRSGCTLTLDSCELDANGDIVCETYGTGILIITNSSITNTKTNSTGILINDAGGTVTIGNNLFTIPAGTGYAIQGPFGGIVYHANNVFTTANSFRSTAIAGGFIALPNVWQTKS